MTRLAKYVFATLLVLQTTAVAAIAQGRGRGGSAAGPAQMGQMGRAGQASAAFSSSGRAGAGSSPSIASARPSSGRFEVRPQRQVFLGSPYPWLYESYGYPYHSLFPYGSLYSEPYPVEPSPNYVEPSPGQSSVELANQVERLTKEVERLREQQANSTAIAPAPPPVRAPERPAIPINLVFRDGRRLNIQSYAIVRGTLWVLDESTRRIPLSDLDLDATHRANPSRVLLLPAGN
jgi:hypothetical protein